MRGILLTSVLSIAFYGGADAGSKIPLSAAIAQCERLSAGYANTLVGQGGETPDNDQIEQRFRSCVHAKAGSYPPKRNNRTGVRVSGSAAFGIVVK